MEAGLQAWERVMLQVLLRTVCLFVLTTAGCAIGGAQPVSGVVCIGQPVAITGRIAKIKLDRGEGTPALEVKASSGRVWTVWLGSTRYLVEMGFNPKAGEAVSIRGYTRLPSSGPAKTDLPELWASTVTLTDRNQTVRLRNDSGRPVWRRGRCVSKD
jgi:hypothetical protein